MNKKFQKTLSEKTELHERSKLMEETLKKLESEKVKLSEKWIKLSSKSRGESKAKERV